MKRVLRRETFIALRARRQAHQIAREILNPPMVSDLIPHEPKIPIDPSLILAPLAHVRGYVLTWRQKQERLALLLAIFAMILLLWVVTLLAK